MTFVRMAVTPPTVVRGPANRAFRVLVKGTALITLGGVAVIGQDFGWWGEKPLTCQAPGTQTTGVPFDARMVAGATKVTTAATIGQRQGEWLRKLNGPPPSKDEVYALADRAAEGVVVYAAALTAAARDRQQSEYVEKYNRKRKVAKEKQLAQHIAMCAPGCPEAQPNGQPLTVANRTGLTGEALARSAAAAAGFTGRHLEEAVAIAKAESGFRFDATHVNTNGSIDNGGWQINSVHAADPDYANRFDPYANARMAYRISNGGTNWRPWSTWPAVRGSVGTVQPVAGGMTCASYQTSGKGPGPWGGYANGRIPATALAHPASAPRAMFRPDAAVDFDHLNAAFTAAFGKPLGVTDSYRSYGAQVDVKGRKPGLAAKPGTSNHGWGLAADVVLSGFGDPRYAWIQANGARYGWISPDWAKANGSKPEYWHLDYTGKGAAA